MQAEWKRNEWDFPTFLMSRTSQTYKLKWKNKALKFPAFLYLFWFAKNGVFNSWFLPNLAFKSKQNSKLPMVVVDHSHFEVLLIIGDSSGVRVPGTLWVWHHMSYGQAFGHIHSQVMCSGKSSDKLQSMWRKTSNNAISTANKDKVFTNTQAVCTLCLKRKEKVWPLWTLSECLLCWK